MDKVNGSGGSRLQKSEGFFNMGKGLIKRQRENTENVVKLFFITQKILRKKLKKLDNIQKCSINFLNSLGNQVCELKDSLNENAGSVTSSKDSMILERIEYEELNRSSVSMQEADVILEKILEGKEAMEHGFEEAGKIMGLLDKFAGKTKRTSTKEYINDPNKILEDIDIDDFLVKTRHFFENEKVDLIKGIGNKVRMLERENSRLENEYEDLIEALENDPQGNGLRNSIKRIIDLQKELKAKEITISNLEMANEKLFGNLQACQNEVRDDRRDGALEMSQEVNKNLQNENQQMQHEIKKLVKRLQENEERFKEHEVLKDEHQKARTQIEDLTRLKEDQYNSMVKLQEKVIFLQEAMNASKEAHILLQEENFNLKNNSSGAKSIRSGDHNATQEDVQMLADRLLNLEEQNQSLKNKNLELEAQIEAARENESFHTADDSQPAELQMAHKIEEAESEIASLQMKLKFNEQKIDHLNKANQFLEEKLKDYQDSNAFILEENENLKQDKEKVKVENRTLMQEIKEGGDKDSLTRASALVVENEALKQDVEALNSTLEEVKKKMNTLLIDNKSLREHNADLMKKMRVGSGGQFRRRNSDIAAHGRRGKSEGMAVELKGANPNSDPNPESFEFLNMIYIQTNLIEELFKSTF